MQTGTSTPSARIRRTTLTPSRSGIITSRTTTAGGRAATSVQRSAPARGRRHGEALEAQGALEGLPDGGLVVDDEDQRLRGA